MRGLLLLVTTAAFFVLSSPALAAEEKTVGQLITESAELEGEVVVVEGELIGDYGFREDGSMWTQLNGDPYALQPLRESHARGGNIGVGIRVPTELAEGLDPPGGYRNRGPLVRVTGTWIYHDEVRRGETFLWVESLELVEPGRPLTHPTNWWNIAAGLALVVAAYAMWVTRPEE
jgi:hypothetical protein